MECQAQMKTFNYLYGAILGETILRHTDNLSSTLQHKTLSAAEGQQVAMMTIATLSSLRSEKIDDGLSYGDFPPDSKAHYKQCYYEAMDLIIATIHKWFDQPGYKIYQ